jgi:hypothetical protein
MLGWFGFTGGGFSQEYAVLARFLFDQRIPAADSAAISFDKDLLGQVEVIGDLGDFLLRDPHIPLGRAGTASAALLAFESQPVSVPPRSGGLSTLFWGHSVAS